MYRMDGVTLARFPGYGKEFLSYVSSNHFFVIIYISRINRDHRRTESIRIEIQMTFINLKCLHLPTSLLSAKN